MTNGIIVIKFQTEADNKNCDILVSFPTGSAYTHQVVIK